MTTARDIIQASLEQAQVMGAGQVAGGADTARCLELLGEMLDSWSNDGLACPTFRTLSFALQAGKSQYSVGPDQTTTTRESADDCTAQAASWVLYTADGTIFSLRPTLLAGKPSPVVSGDVADVTITAGRYRVQVGFLEGEVEIDGVRTNHYRVTRFDGPAPPVPVGLGTTYNVTAVQKVTRATVTETQADVRTERPVRIARGVGAAYLTDSAGTRYPVQMVELPAWNAIQPARYVQSQLPSLAYWDASFPWANIRFFPAPSLSGVTFSLEVPVAFASLKLDDEVSLPPGYVAAIRSNLTVELWPFFRSDAVSQDVRQSALESLAAVKRTNTRDVRAFFDRALGTRRARYNIYSDR